MLLRRRLLRCMVPSTASTSACWPKRLITTFDGRAEQGVIHHSGVIFLQPPFAVGLNAPLLTQIEFCFSLPLDSPVYEQIQSQYDTCKLAKFRHSSQ